MNIKEAFDAMKTGKAVKFWYCAQDEKGKPRLLCHATAVPQMDIEKVLKTAKLKNVATGIMKIEKPGELSVGVKGQAPTGFAMGVQIAVREANQMPKVMLTTAQALVAEKALGEHYQGEDKKGGWRADGMKPKEGESAEEFAKRQKAVRDGDAVTTKYYNEAEKKAAEITFDQGVAKDAKGQPLQLGPNDYSEKTTGFVIDPKTGKTYGFDGSKVETTSEGKKQWHHHSSPLGGKAVGGAGQIKTDLRGNVTEVSDQSGHYKPDAELTHQAVKHLDEQGALETHMPDGKREAKVRLLDKNAAVTDEQWKDVKGDKAAIDQRVKLNQLKGPLGEQAFANLMLKKPEELKKLLASGKFKAVGDLKAALGANALKQLEAEVKDDPAKLEAKAKELYAKNPGVDVPDNALSSQAYVNLLAGDASANVTKKSQFLQSEGNEAQMRNKERLNRELEEKTAKERETLDRLAEDRADQHEARLEKEKEKTKPKASNVNPSTKGELKTDASGYIAEVPNVVPEPDEKASPGGYVDAKDVPKKTEKKSAKHAKPVDMKVGADNYVIEK
jgi:hypothetical protein